MERDPIVQTNDNQNEPEKNNTQPEPKNEENILNKETVNNDSKNKKNEKSSDGEMEDDIFGDSPKAPKKERKCDPERFLNKKPMTKKEAREDRKEKYAAERGENNQDKIKRGEKMTGFCAKKKEKKKQKRNLNQRSEHDPTNNDQKNTIKKKEDAIDFSLLPLMITTVDAENNEKHYSVIELMNQIYTNDANSSYNKNADTIPEEDDEGCTEYKLKLVNPSEDRLYHLKTQMKFRIGEGKGEAFYNVKNFTKIILGRISR